MNGATPLSSGRQASSGITLNSSSDVKFYNNISWARYDGDFGYTMYNKSQCKNFEASNNLLAKGKSDLTWGT